MKKKIVIIGAGISGMVAGVYALKQGFDAEIYESNPNAGGECTGWDRKGYHFDGCIHWLTGTKPGTDLYDIWQKCGALDDSIKIINHDYYIAYKDTKDYSYFYCNPKKLISEFMKISPEDEAEIKLLAKMVKKFAVVSMPAKKPMDMMKPMELIKFIFSSISMKSAFEFASKTSLTDYINRFKSSKIRAMLSSVAAPEGCAMSVLGTIGLLAGKDGGVPEGGSVQFSNRIKDKFISLGGKLHLSTKAEHIIVQNGTATGIEFTDKGGNKTAVAADYVITAVNAKLLLEKLLDGKYKDTFFDERFANSKDYPLFGEVDIHLGINADLSGLPHNVVFKASEPINCGGNTSKYIGFKQYCEDPWFTKNGKSALTASFVNTSYDYWKKLREASEESYKNEKSRLAEDVIRELTIQYPQISGKVEAIDVVTPLTHERYCGAYRGSYMSFITTPRSNQNFHRGTISGINNLYVASQWIRPVGGLPSAAMAGKFAIQRICRQEGISIEI